MARTTLNIDTPLLEELRRLQRQDAKPMGRLVSELLTEALAQRRQEAPDPPRFAWVSKPMEPRIRLEDKEALWGLVDGDSGATG